MLYYNRYVRGFGDVNINLIRFLHHIKFLNIYKLNGGFCYGSKSKLL